MFTIVLTTTLFFRKFDSFPFREGVTGFSKGFHILLRTPSSVFSLFSKKRTFHAWRMGVSPSGRGEGLPKEFETKIVCAVV